MDPLAPDFENTPVSPQRPRFDYTLEQPTDAAIVSIITPYYNRGDTLEQTAQSIFRQSLQQWEWLIINDATYEPESLRALDVFRDVDPRVRVIDLQTNVGPSRVRNIGLENACADLVFFLDADDLIEPTTLEKLVWCLESHSEFAFCKGYTINFGAQQYYGKVGFSSRNLFLTQNPVTITALVRREVALSVGGFDVSLLKGLEDWDFWLRCAEQGYWGGDIPEYFDWYRRRETHADRWKSWTNKGIRETRKLLKSRYPFLCAHGIPQLILPPPQPYEALIHAISFENKLVKHHPRLLMIIPWMAMGGADKFNLNLVAQLQARGYEVTVVTTLPENYPWYQEYARLTPDIFILPNFLCMKDYPRFLHYLIKSRQFDLVMLSNSEMGYKLFPYLLAHCPEVSFVDYCHMEEEYWCNGGYPRFAVAYQELLDLNIVASQHLKEWMVKRGADAEQIEVCHINIDTVLFSPDETVRQRVRSELEIPGDMPVILYAGRICTQKQPRVFAKVMEALKSHHLEFACLVAGDGKDYRWLTSYIRRHHLNDCVKLLGAVSNDRVKELLSASDIFFLPSQMEGISLAIYEAMAMRVVPVGADVGGQKELVTPECGVLIQRGTEAEEIAAYTTVLQHLIQSPAVRVAMGRAARSRVREQFDLGQMGYRMSMLLEKAISLHSSCPVLSKGLGAEHTVQALEYERLRREVMPLLKYHAFESCITRVKFFFQPFVVVGNETFWLLLEWIRPIKDAVWILGHRVKVSISKDTNTEGI